jgi:hypothetical protein
MDLVDQLAGGKGKKTKVEFNLKTVLGNDVTKKQLLGYIEEIILHENAMKHAREGIKDIKGEAETTMGIPTSLLNDLVKERLDNGGLDARIKTLEESLNLAIGLGITGE